MKKQKILFLDRDGTLILEPSDYQVDSYEKLVFYPQVIQYLSKIVRELDYQLVMITNQDGLGTAAFPENTFWPPHNKMLDILRSEGIEFVDVLIDRTFAKDNAPTRKPNTGLLTQYLEGDYDLANSIVIGDRLTDMELAKNIGGKGIFIYDHPELGAGEISAQAKVVEASILLKTRSWREIYQFLSQRSRMASVHRKTKETDIKVEVDLDGTGRTQNQTGIGFFDHMLDQLGKHSACDLVVMAEGDLHIDEHHTIEDIAITIGQAFHKALGNKKGIERYGHYVLPMDDCLAQVAIDFSGRPWLVWNVNFQREKIGGMPTEMFHHFFKSFSDHAQCNINIKAEGKNEHHKIEAIFKAFARAIKMAVRRDPEIEELPSTKGVL